MNPGTHCQLRDEDIAAFGKKDGSFSGDHFHFWIGFHDLLDTRQRKLVNFEVMGVCFEMVDGLLPICRKDLARRSSQTLVDLEKSVSKTLFFTK